MMMIYTTVRNGMVISMHRIDPNQESDRGKGGICRDLLINGFSPNSQLVKWIDTLLITLYTPHGRTPQLQKAKK